MRAANSKVGVSVFVDGRMTPLVAVAPSAIWPHPSEQG